MSAKIFLIEQDGVEYYFAATSAEGAFQFGLDNDFVTDLDEYTVCELPESEWDKHQVYDPETAKPIKSFRDWVKDEVKDIPDCIASTMEW